MERRTNLPFKVKCIEHTWVPLADGCCLAARIWLPENAVETPVPAILEYLPYRKNDGTARRDADRHPYLAGHGYAAIRVDIRGAGDSDGLLLDEYLAQELNDCCELLDWIAAQPWCNGNVGMFGKSWGGFNALQVAALQPEPLKAIITIASTDDRYADDVHYMGGCILASQMLSWASVMLLYNARPPDPRFVGDDWRDQWLERLEKTPPWIHEWLTHQRRDAYWQHGSVCEDYSQIKIPVYAVGSWADGYTNAVPRLLRELKTPTKGLIGPWGHNFPEDSRPGPSIGFLQESLRWWDHWLKDVENDVMSDQKVHIWLEDGQKPATDYDVRTGQWVTTEGWPSDKSKEKKLFFTPTGLGNVGNLTTIVPDSGTFQVTSDERMGRDAGIWLAFGRAGEFPPDQRAEDNRAVAFTSVPADTPQPIIGQPRVNLVVSSDRPVALIAARLCDVAPDGSSTLVSWGLLNLNHRYSHEHPSELKPGETYELSFLLNMVGYTLPAGHRWRVTLSPDYWPHAWPSPEKATLTVYSGPSSGIDLPAWSGELTAKPIEPFGPPEGTPPLPVKMEREAHFAVENHENVVTGRLTRTVHDDAGATYFIDADLLYDQRDWEIMEITPGDPLSAVTRCRRLLRMVREGSFEIDIETDSKMWSDKTHFHTHSLLNVTLDGEPFFNREWDFSILRDNV